nr:2-oxoisovalerate dehydrogenase subunit beta 1, mitochondrial [Tanacetum cinerariifolium]
MLNDMLLPKSDVPSRWVKQIPIKVNVLAWKISMDRLPTRVNLHRRGVQVSPISCPICCEALENLDHLLFCCDLAKDIARFNQVRNRCWKECFTLPGGVSGHIETISSSMIQILEKMGNAYFLRLRGSLAGQHHENGVCSRDVCVGQFYDKGLEVAFRKSTCFVRNEDGVDLLTGDRSSYLHTIALNEVASNSLACLLAKASSSQSWLWHQRISHLNFVTINNLVKNNLVQGLPKMKFKKDHLCSACEQGKIHRKYHKSKTAFASNKPLYLLHMDFCGPMRIESINGKRLSSSPSLAGDAGNGKSINLYTAINQALQIALDSDPRSYVFGEDVGFGGVFRCTTGLADQFGKHRVFNTPLCEQRALSSLSDQEARFLPTVLSKILFKPRFDTSTCPLV